MNGVRVALAPTGAVLLAVGVTVGEGVMVGDGVMVAVVEGVPERLAVDVVLFEGVTEIVELALTVDEADGVGVAVADGDGVGVCVGVCDDVGVALGAR